MIGEASVVRWAIGVPAPEGLQVRVTPVALGPSGWVADVAVTPVRGAVFSDTPAAVEGRFGGAAGHAATIAWGPHVLELTLRAPGS